MTPAELGAAIHEGLRLLIRPAIPTERALGEAVAHILHGRGYCFEREFALNGRDRPDFVVGLAPVIAIELKVKSSPAEVMRQLARYAEHPDVSGMLLITTRSAHTSLPATLGGKPLAVCLITDLYL